MITALIDKFDTFEIIRDKIAQILADESASQVALATTAGKPDPSLWRLAVFTERASPWDDPDDGDIVVNVWYDTANIDRAASGSVERQTMQGVFNVDVIGFGVSEGEGEGHLPGDEVAARTAHRGVRLVRNILMAGEYTYLGMRPIVGARAAGSVTAFQPQLNDKANRHAVGARISFEVRYSEYSPQFEPVALEELFVDLKRAETGEVLATVQYNFTNP